MAVGDGPGAIGLNLLGQKDRKKASGERQEQEQARKLPPEQEWHELGGEPQTDALFDHEIIQRMGTDFSAQVFAPAIAQAVEQGRSYESIRDTLRKAWTPTR